MDRKAELLEQLQEIQNETVTLPGDVSLAYTTGRPELLALACRDMKKDEVRAVLDALAGQMRMNRVMKELVEELENQRRRDIEGVFNEVRKTLDRASAIHQV